MPFETNQLHESDLRSFIPQRTGCPLGKDLTVADVTRLAIENVEEIFLQGFAASPRFARTIAPAPYPFPAVTLNRIRDEIPDLTRHVQVCSS